MANIHVVTVVHWINHYPLDDAITSDTTYQLNSDLHQWI